ncbi:MAG: hypothetical protein ABIO21_10250 [Pseudomonas sp.]
MAHAHNSSAEISNPRYKELKRNKQENNEQWMHRAIKKLDLSLENWSYIALFGGRDIMAFRLRVAQSHLRSDLLPSYWSEAALIKVDGDNLTATHVPLFQPERDEFATKRNGVVEQPLSHFTSAERWENISVIALPVPQATILQAIETFKHSRSPVDSLEYVLRWLAFSWGAGRTANPIHEGIGLPSATMLEVAYNAVQFDLTPGLESRASCPEYLWIMAKYWYPYYEQVGSKETPRGYFFTPDSFSIREPR